MDKWDKAFKKHEIIQKYPVENGMEKEIDYLYIKMPVSMTDREIVQEKKTWSEFNGNPKNMLIVQRSITNSKYPVKEKPIIFWKLLKLSQKLTGANFETVQVIGL